MQSASSPNFVRCAFVCFKCLSDFNVKAQALIPKTRTYDAENMSDHIKTKLKCFKNTRA